MENKKRMHQKEDVPVSQNYVVGRNALRELLRSEKDIDKIFVLKGERDGSLAQLLFQAKEKKIPIIETERVRLEKMAGSGSHQGVVCAVAEQNYATVDDILALAQERGEKPLVVVCDGIEDPHNLGAIIRSAECMGAHGVIIPKRRAVGLTAVVSKASAGALAHLPVAKVANIPTLLEDLKEKGLWIYAADMDGAPYYDTDLTGACAIVLGAEGAGVSRLVKERCDFVVSIPQHGKVNSLNVSNAAAVILCEAARRRHTV
ncbi:MAG: 23S rRNA (guanosine(2251)-2'-O)-methyltransferase RlmB [Clostridia bacterium]|nr:23S rRNA (guanosine(2251)-2'-O)-methyltransferase RlmB [Clostridia bacterium]